MKKLYINDENEDKINALCQNAEGKARSRTLAYSDFKKIVTQAENRFDKYRFSPQERNGASLSFGYYEQPPNAYKYPYIGTIATLKRNSIGWYVEAVSRERCNGITFNRLHLTEEQESIIRYKAVRDFAPLDF